MRSLWIDDYKEMAERYASMELRETHRNNLSRIVCKNVVLRLAPKDTLSAVLDSFKDYSGMDLAAYKRTNYEELSTPYKKSCIVLSQDRTLHYFVKHTCFPHWTNHFPPGCIVLVPKDSWYYKDWLSDNFINLMETDDTIPLTTRTICL